MSDSHAVPSPGDPPVGSPVTSPGASPVKRRNPRERALVWTLIAALFVLASVETWSRYSYQRAYDFLGHRLEVGDEHTSEALNASDVKDFLGGRKPSRTEDFIRSGTMSSNGATHLEVYSWFTLNPVHRREMFVYYDVHGPAAKDHPQVISIQADADELFPTLTQLEQPVLTRAANEGTEWTSPFMHSARLQQGLKTGATPTGNMSSGMPGGPGMRGMPDMGPRGGRGAKKAEEPQADRPVDQPGDQPGGEAGQKSTPETEKSEI